MLKRRFRDERLLVVAPRAGLANRMRALVSAARLAELGQRRLVVYWRRNRDCGAAFEDLFESDAERIASWAPVFLSLPQVTFAGSGKQSVEPLLGKRVLVLDTCHFRYAPGDVVAGRAEPGPAYWAALRPYFSRFRPAPALRAKIDAFCDTHFKGPVLGVQVRRGDNAACLRHSPTHGFFAEIDRSDAKHLFLSTDSPDVEQAFRRRYGSRVLLRAKRSRNRGQTAAIQDALVDLFLLMRCRRILKSYWSSFGDVAALCSGVPAKTIDVLTSSGVGLP